MSYLESSFCLTPWGALQCELYLETEGPDFCILTRQSLAVSCLQEKGVSSQEKGLLLAKGKSALNTHWKNWCWSSSSNILANWCEDLTHSKKLWYWERLKARGEGTTEDEMVGWYHQVNGHKFEQTPGDGEDREAWCAIVHEVAKSWTVLSDWTELNWTQESPCLLMY